MKRFWLDILSSVLLGKGIILLLLPFFANWWINADNERYLWAINGPFPFSDWGSIGFQLQMHLTLFLFGFLLIALGLVLRKMYLKDK